MLPLKLSIEGLYSYQEIQTIDFKRLTNVGLFGIFGSVGSGKSSILEAISFALYGTTERLNSRDNRNYNMMNLKSTKVFIDFEFENFEGGNFRFISEWKRKKNFDDAHSPSRRILKLKDGEWIPEEKRNVESIVGMKYENFRRTIIIPQGKFQEFLELGEAHRTLMMMDIFKLHRYDLQDNIKKLSIENKSQIDILSGTLKTYEEVNPDDLKTIKEKFLHHNKLLEQHIKQYQDLEKEVNKLKKVKEKFETLALKEGELASLKDQEESFQKRKDKIILFEQIDKLFSPLLKKQEELSNKSNSLNKHKTKVVQEKSAIYSLLQTTITNFEKIKVQYQELDHLNATVKEYDIIKELFQHESESKVITKRIYDGNKTVQAAILDSEEALKTIANLELNLENLKSVKIDTSVFLEAGAWYQKHRQVIENWNQRHQKLNRLQKDLQDKEKVFETLKLNQTTWEEDLKKQETLLAIKEEEYLKEEQNLLIAKQLEQFTDALEQGKACPLCGSLDHPEIMKTSDVAIGLEHNKALRKSLKIEKEKLHFIKEQAHQIIAEEQVIINQIGEVNQELHELNSQKSILERQFIWKEFDKDNPEIFEKRKKELSDNEKEISKHEHLLKQQRANSQKLALNVIKYKEAIQKFELDNKLLESKIETCRSKVVMLDIDSFIQDSPEQILFKKDKLSKQIQYIQKEYDDLSLQINDLNPKLAAKQAQEEEIEKQLKELEFDITHNLSIINELLEKNELRTIEEVQDILKSVMVLETEKNAIDVYFKRLFTAESQVKELKEILANIEFSNSRYEEQVLKFNELKSVVDDLQVTIRTLEIEISKLEKDIAAKEKLTSKMSVLENRRMNLHELTRLFVGNGFVNFISGIYLENLCKMANIRFHKLTSNQLSLCLNKKNEFEVIDYLNNGNRRSVKTLSGGQTFQASLSLALALAESTQVENKSAKNFFFIDEGFGTQDKEMIQVVFDTLQSLHQENRIVGIISHVEELQEQISASLFIENDSEKGSIIHPYYS